MDELSNNILNKTSIIFTPKFHCELVREGIEYIRERQRGYIVVNHYHLNDWQLILKDW